MDVPTQEQILIQKKPSNNQWNGTCAARLTDFLARLGSKIWVERPERSSQRTVAE